ncbi:MAG: hypothetical protein HC774_03020, partial [Sphingomonadales bacterium]|nr:hypothetical protein [Sphingomonadales bacterium]
MATALLALDQGTTSSRAIVFGLDLAPISTGQVELPQHFPASGQVEHDAEDIWSTTRRVRVRTGTGTASGTRPRRVGLFCLDARTAARKLGVSAELAQSGEAVKRFFREARASSVLESDHIVQIFDFDRVLGGTQDGYKVLDATRYHDEVINKLRSMGFCAWYDSEEIQVKNTNHFSAHWDIYKAEG